MSKGRVVWIALVLSLFVCTVASAKVTIYLKDGDVIEARSAWRDFDTIQVLVNRDTLLTFDENAVDLKKTKIKKKSQNKLIDEVIELSLARIQLQQLLSPSSTDDDIGKLLQKSITFEQAETIVRRHYRKLNERKLTEILVWLSSPTGIRISEAETAHTSDKKEKMKAFMDKEATPEMPERLRLLEEIDRSMALTEMERAVVEKSIRQIAEKLPQDLPNRAVFLKNMQDSIPVLEQLRRENVAESSYTFRDLSVDELRDYLHFLQTPTGKAYSVASINAITEITCIATDKLAVQMAKDLREQVANPKHSPATALSSAEICSISAKEAQKRLPIRIDEVTTLTDITCESTNLVYHYTVSNSVAENLVANQTQLKAGIRTNACNNSSVRETYLKNGVSVMYFYNDESGKPLVSMTIAPDDCGK